MSAMRILSLVALMGAIGCEPGTSDEADASPAHTHSQELSKELEWEYNNKVDLENFPPFGTFKFGTNAYKGSGTENERTLILVGETLEHQFRITNYGEHELRMEVRPDYGDFKIDVWTAHQGLPDEDETIVKYIQPESYAIVVVTFQPQLFTNHLYGKRQTHPFIAEPIIDFSYEIRDENGENPIHYNSQNLELTLIGMAQEPSCPVAEFTGSYLDTSGNPSTPITQYVQVFQDYNPKDLYLRFDGTPSYSVHSADDWVYHKWQVYHSPDNETYTEYSPPHYDEAELIQTGNSVKFEFHPEECGHYLLELTVEDTLRESCQPAQQRFTIPCD